MSKWGSIRLVGSYAHQALQAKIAFEIAERDGHFRRTLARERKAAFRGELDREEAKRLYSKAAMDQRCELRHIGVVVSVLRQWSHVLEDHERRRAGARAASVTEAMYNVVLWRRRHGAWDLALNSIYMYTLFPTTRYHYNHTYRDTMIDTSLITRQTTPTHTPARGERDRRTQPPRVHIHRAMHLSVFMVSGIVWRESHSASRCAPPSSNWIAVSALPPPRWSASAASLAANPISTS